MLFWYRHTREMSTIRKQSGLSPHIPTFSFCYYYCYIVVRTQKKISSPHSWFPLSHSATDELSLTLHRRYFISFFVSRDNYCHRLKSPAWCLHSFVPHEYWGKTVSPEFAQLCNGKKFFFLQKPEIYLVLLLFFFLAIYSHTRMWHLYAVIQTFCV